ncbi:MAG: tRNA pseudouridine(55) synthase TruB [Spirochaetales bacterium]|jgi:tRNA pseudouridine55 synthase|nr:tRNA pseudouridine(55) synthase TruB [Spirochaetales bacterium]
MSSANGLLLLSKPCGITSFAALAAVKKKLGTQKVGHTGTLDKFAEGLLVVLCGRYTRLAPFISGMDKRYSGIFEFGAETATLDPEGEIVRRGSLPEAEAIESAVKNLTGPIMQRPPDFSAVHIDGKRAYERALRGEDVEIPERPVTIYSFDIQDWQPPFLSCSVHCSKGTYIRSLARDLGRAVSSCAYVKSLRRTQVGPFILDEAVSLDEFSLECVKSGREFLERLVPGKSAVVKDGYYESLRMGKPLRDDFFETPPADARDGAAGVLVFTRAGDLAAVISRNEKGYAYHFVCA